ncbi:Ig-like domain-containing protein [Myxococcus sp. K38C18041901]|uniref:Ig-like domain-containing protein n=1 Tax=Myxococcus guangdongensis TaxID=2906760 RepID=UPI0020A7CBA3|nr:Ig-like domain-containing protein [Myxococcus guangdongensis]MCP3061965.1 Ig-like domain-containing protein [Myxococcus guangdongensis]
MSVSLRPSTRLLGWVLLCLGLLLGCGEDSPPQQFAPPPLMPDAVASGVLLTPSGQLIADGVSRGEITVFVKDENGAPMAGRTVAVAVSGEGNVVTQPGRTDAAGVAVGFVASTRGGVKRVTASVAAEGGSVVLVSQPTFTFASPVATRLEFSVSIVDGSAGARLPTLAVSFVDANGRLVADATSPVTLSLSANPEGAVLEGTLTAPPVNGTARFDDLLVRKAVVGRRLVASAPGVADGTLDSFNVLPGPPASLEVEGLEAVAVAGTQRSAQVTVRDASGNVVTTYRGTLGLLATDALALLPASHAFTPQDMGRFTFTGITLNRAGVHQLTVLDVGLSTLSARRTVGVVAGAASVLAITSAPPVASVRGELAQVTVELRDAHGNVALVGAPQVTLALEEGGPLVGVTQVAPVDGVARFTGLRVDTDGDFHLLATASGLTQARSPTLSIIDDIPPAQPTLALGTLGTDSVTLTWTAVGDDDLLGRATAQSLRYSVSPIVTAADFDAATPVAGVGAPAEPGTAESATISDLMPQQTYYAALRVTDNRGNAALSNSLAFQTQSNDVTQVVFTPQPASGIAGQPLAEVVVSLQNPQGDVVTSATLPVTLSLVGGEDFEPVQVSAVAGVARFTNLVLEEAGTYRFVASANGLTTQSDEFDIDAGAPSELVLTGLASTVAAGHQSTVTVTVVDAFGNTVRNHTGAVVLTSTDPDAGLPSSHTFTAQDQGVHTFGTPVVLVTTGPQRVTATGASQLTGFVETQVTSGAAHHLTLEGLPAVVEAGSEHVLTLRVRDAFDNLVTGYTGIVELESSDTKAELPSTLTFAAQDAGQRTFTVALKSSGTHSLTVSEAGGGLSVEVEAEVTAGPAVSMSLTVATPMPTVGQPVNVTVTLLDVHENPASGYRGTVAVRVDQDPGAAPTPFTFTEASAGVHVFSVTFTESQSTTVSAEDTGNPALTASQAVNVLDAPAPPVQPLRAHPRR